jgi:hypothetical protein
MRKLIAAVIATFILAPGAHAAELTKPEHAFVNAYLATAVVAIKCPHIHVVTGGATRWADSVGVDGIRFGNAIRAGMANRFGEDFNPDQIIPEVSFMLEPAMNGIAAEIDESPRKHCAEWVETLGHLGFIEGGSHGRR